MKTGLYIFLLCFNLLIASLFGEINTSDRNGVYIVYMGASVSPNGTPRNDHAQLLNSLMKRKKDSVVQTYKHGFSGFAARLSEEEAKSISQKPGVVSVFPDPVLRLHTTRSWDFLKYQTTSEIYYNPSSSSPLNSSSNGAADTVIGFLDTGIWPESESFIDKDMGPIPPSWKGECMEGKDFTSSNCNRKVIGARYYEDSDSESLGTPRDEDGHGTHVASTAAGSLVSGASYYGLAKGTAESGSPKSRIAMYRVCKGDCFGSAILKAFDDAIFDGVDVLSVSLGSAGSIDFSTDPIAIGSFHAVEKGIVVVCSAGNSGPYPASVENYAPWIITVGATTIDRDFEADVVLGDKRVIKGGSINFSNLKKSPTYPLIDGISAKRDSDLTSEIDARNCIPGSLDDKKVNKKIVLCGSKGNYEQKVKVDALMSQGAIGMILIDNNRRQVPLNSGYYPFAAVTEEDGAEILSYINSNSNPLGTILSTVVNLDYKPAPVVAYFSSKGPIYRLKNLLKPDIVAPGVAILAAWPTNDTSVALPREEPPLFEILSGTSMSCPHVSGLAATVKSQHPTWSTSAIKSAIMTTAIQTDNLHNPITTINGSKATPYDIGAGEISITGPFNPGLVYETETMEYIQFLCNIGYDTTMIKKISLTVPRNFSCPEDSSINSDSISNMNYPSIVISNLKENEKKTVSRTVTIVGEDESIYTAIVDAPAGLNVEVVPNKLQFTKDEKKLSYQMTIKLTVFSKKDLFGSITWSNDKYKVRSPFIVSNTQQ